MNELYTKQLQIEATNAEINIGSYRKPVYRYFTEKVHRDNFLKGDIWFAGRNQNIIFNNDPNEYNSVIFLYPLSFTKLDPTEYTKFNPYLGKKYWIKVEEPHRLIEKLAISLKSELPHSISLFCIEHLIKTLTGFAVTWMDDIPDSSKYISKSIDNLFIINNRNLILFQGTDLKLQDVFKKDVLKNITDDIISFLIKELKINPKTLNRKLDKKELLVIKDKCATNINSYVNRFIDPWLNAHEKNSWSTYPTNNLIVRNLQHPKSYKIYDIKQFKIHFDILSSREITYYDYPPLSKNKEEEVKKMFNKNKFYQNEHEFRFDISTSSLETLNTLNTDYPENLSLHLIEFLKVSFPEIGVYCQSIN